MENAQTPNPDPITLSPPAEACLAFLSLAGGARVGIDLISRYEARYARQFARAYDLPRKHQGPEK